MLDGARELWSDLDPAVAHCNHGSYGAVARPVSDYQAALRRQAERNPNQWFRFELPERLEAARLHMAGFLRSEAEGTVFVPNATTGINVALAAVELNEGDEVLVTDHVYGAVLRTARRATGKVAGAVTVAAVDLLDDEDRVVEGVLAAVTERTRVAIIDHIAAPTGLVLPIGAIVNALRSRGVVSIVDAAHAPGRGLLNVAALGADFWTGNFHKWSSAPRPCAALAVGDGWRDRTEPLVASFGLEAGMPTSFSWHGTDDYSSYLCLQSAVEVLDGFGWETLWAHNDTLAAYGARLVADALGVAPALPAGAASCMGLVPLPDGVATTDEDARSFIAAVSSTLGVEVAANPWRGRGWLRLSAHAYNLESDYERLATGLPGLLDKLVWEWRATRGATFH